MASESDIIQRESGGDPYVGYTPPGQRKVSLKNAPLNQFGFPIWEGNMGPAGISHAAGLYQFQPRTWEPGARALGIKDFSPASQKAVYDWTRAREGEAPWAASAPGGGGGKLRGNRPEGYDPATGETYVTIPPAREPDNLAGMYLLQKLMGGQALGDDPQAGQDDGMALLTSLMGPPGTPPEGTQASEATDTFQPLNVSPPPPAALAEAPPPLDAGSIKPVGQEVMPAAFHASRELGDQIFRSQGGLPSDENADLSAGGMNRLPKEDLLPPSGWGGNPPWSDENRAKEQGASLLNRLLNGLNPIGSAQAAEGRPPPPPPPAPQAEQQAGMSILQRLMSAVGDPDVAGGTESRTPPPPATDLSQLTGMPSALERSAQITAERPYKPGMTAGQMMGPSSQDDPMLYALSPGSIGLGRGPGFMPRVEPTGEVGKAVGTVRKTINAIFSPSTVDATSLEAESVIRQSTGMARRETAAAVATVEPHRRLVNAHIPELEQWMRAKAAGVPVTGKPALLRFLDFVEGRSTGVKYDGPPELRPLADDLRKLYRERRMAIEAEPTTESASFIEDYYSHQWQEFEKVRAEMAGGGQGSGRSLKERSIPTISEGIDRGYTPVTLDPIEMTLRYAANMDRYLAHNRTFRISHDAGIIRFHPANTQPEGWKQLQGRMAERGHDKAYAPEAFARVYNNAVSSGVYADRLGGDIYNALLKTKNTINSFVLGMSGYHATAMAQEASASALARAIGGVAEGEAAAVAKQLGLGGMPFAKSVSDVVSTGRKLQRQYLRVDDYGPDYENVAKLLAEGGGRIVGRGQEWRGTAADNFFKSWQRGALKIEALAAGREIRDNPLRTPLVAARELARINDTVMAPIFDGMIPRLKSAAFFDEMHAWLEANPQASRTEQLAKSRQLVDVIDDRFGEMILDNIFWGKRSKQFLQLATVSLGWELGTLRSGLGGAADLARGQPLSPRVRYLMGLAGAVALYNSSYEYLMTGKGPQSATDLVTARTGGKTPEGAPERALLPGYEKDALGWWHHPTQEPFNKISPLIRMGAELTTGRDYFGHEIAPFAPLTPDWFKAYGGHVLGSMTPIPLKSEYLKGTAIPTWQRFMGVRSAPEYIQNPQRFDDMETKRRLMGLQSELRGLYAHGARTQEDRTSIEKKAAEIKRRIRQTNEEAAQRRTSRKPPPASFTVNPPPGPR